MPTLRSLLDRARLLAQHEGMRHTFPILLRAGLALSLAAGAARAAEFDAYEVILSRQPFGTPAVEKAPDPSSMPPPEAFILGYRLTAITRDEAGLVHVGIVEQKTGKSYLLGRGENEDGLFIGDVEIESGEAQLCKGDEKYWMSLLTGGVASNHAARAAATNKAPVKPAAAVLPPIPPAPPSSAVFTPPRHLKLPLSAMTNLSYAARKQFREDLRRRAADELSRRAAEAQQLSAAEKPADGPAPASSLMTRLANSTDEELPALINAADATNRASLISLLEQIGYTNADSAVETEPVE